MSASTGEWLRIHAFVPESYANGPGRRAVVWVQGCSLGCPGCFNPETHSFAGGWLIRVEDLFAQIVAESEQLEGITLSGGEPLQQQPSVLVLLRRIRRETSLSVVMLTGFSWDEVQSFPNLDEWRSLVDVLIAGRYDARQHLARDLRGSSNKTVHIFSERYQRADFEMLPTAEVILDADGGVVLTGVEPMRWL